MAFNSNTYHRNKMRREAQTALAEARDAKAMGRSTDMVRCYVNRARMYWKSYLSYLSMKRCDDDLKAFRAGKMTYEEFMSKWSPTNA